MSSVGPTTAHSGKGKTMVRSVGAGARAGGRDEVYSTGVFMRVNVLCDTGMVDT